MSIEDALAQADAGDFVGALSTLLTRWRAAPHPQIADAIDAVSQLVGPAQPPLDAGTGNAHRAWLARADAQAPQDLHRLLMSLTTVVSRLGLARLQALQRWPADPRLFRALHRHLEQIPWRKLGAGDAFGLLAIEVLVGSGSAESHAHLRALADLKRGSTWPTPTAVDAAIVAAADVLSALPPEALGAEEQAGCAAIITLVGHASAPTSAEQTVIELFAQIYADPDDRDTRAVLADALLAQDDPRGAFIALQLARAADAPPSAAESALLRQHERAWLGPLAPVLAKSPQGWRDGFLERARLARVFEGFDPSLAAWSTVRHLDFSPVEFTPRTGFADLLLSPNLQRLDAVIGLRARDLRTIFPRRRPVGWSTLGVRYCDDAVKLLKRLKAPDLRHFEQMDGSGRPDETWIERLVAQAPGLRRIGVGTRSVRWTEIAVFPGALEQVEVYSRDDYGRRCGWAIRFSRACTTIEFEYHGGDTDPVETLLAMIGWQGKQPVERMCCAPSAALTDLDWTPVRRQTGFYGIEFVAP